MTSTQKSLRYCLYLPDGNFTSRIKPIVLPEDATVDDMVNRVHTLWPTSMKDVTTQEITVFKCGGLPFDPIDTLADRANEWIRKHTSQDKMLVIEPLDHYFPKGPTPRRERKIDIIVVTPAILESDDIVLGLPGGPDLKYVRARRSLADKIRYLPSPSECTKDVSGVTASNAEGSGIHAHRPASNHGPPTAIFHPTLGKFKHFLDHLDELQELEPTSHMLEKCHSFIKLASKIYSKEKEREEVLKDRVEWLVGEPGSWQVILENTRIKPDATFGRPVILIWEGKNEDGISGSPSLQATVVFAKLQCEAEFQRLIGKSNCPVILVGMAGTRLEFSTAIFTNGIYVDKLTSFDLRLGAWQSDEVLRLGRIFTALFICLSELRHYYTSLTQTTQAPHSARHLFPDPAPVVAGTQMPDLTYTGKLEHGDYENPNHGRRLDIMHVDDKERPHALYVAKMKMTGGDDVEVVVKFASRYNEQAHRLLADRGLAPKLRFFAPVLGGLYMVVMDYVVGITLDGATIPYEFMPVYEKVETAVKLLHEKDLVFGDLRSQNIILNQEGNPILVDFDWAGRHKVDRYPATLNDGIGMIWAEGVGRWTVMEKEHDIFMLNRLRVFLEQAKGTIGSEEA